MVDYTEIAEDIMFYRQKLLELKRNHTERRENYVYVVYVDEEVKYVGRGKGNRLRHANSGTSHVYELNRDHFAGKRIEVKILIDGLSLDQAKIVEKDYIKSYAKKCDLYNIQR